MGAQYHADPILRPPRFALAAKISGIIPAITGRRSSKFRAHFVPLVTFQNIERFPPMPRLAIGFADKLGGQVRLSLSLSLSLPIMYAYFKLISFVQEELSKYLHFDAPLQDPPGFNPDEHDMPTVRLSLPCSIFFFFFERG